MTNDNLQKDPIALVDALARADERFDAYLQLRRLGEAALPALRDGLRHGHWEVRRWSAICLDQVADAEALEALVPLLRDPKSKVRLWAVHSIACEHCKPGVTCPVDVVPLLIDRVEHDDSIRVRRMAVAMLGTDFADRRALSVFGAILREETDRKLRLHAERGLARYAKLGLATAD